MKRLALVAAAVLVLAGCSSAPKNADGDKTVTATLDGQHVRVDLPAGKVQGLAVWFHGQGGSADTRMNEAWLNALRVQGWAVASSDFHGNAWGNAAAVSDTKGLIAWASEQSGAPTKKMFVAGSMGGLNSLTYLASGGDAPKCWYGTMPVVDVTTVGNVPDAAEQISAAYGGAAPKPVDLTKLPAIRYRVAASPEDTWVPAAKNADALAASLKKSAREVSMLTVRGEHGDPSHFNERDLVDFAKGCG